MATSMPNPLRETLLMGKHSRSHRPVHFRESFLATRAAETSMSPYYDMLGGQRTEEDRAVRAKVAQQMDTVTDLVAGSDVEEPRSLGILRTETFLSVYLLLCLMLNVVVVCSLERGLMQCVYLVRAGMELLGLFAVRRKRRVLSLLYVVYSGVALLVGAAPALGALLLLFSPDICRHLGDMSGPHSDASFVDYCARHVGWVRLSGSVALAGEMALGAYAFMQLAKQHRYITQLHHERSSLRKYTGSERIALSA